MNSRFTNFHQELSPQKKFKIVLERLTNQFRNGFQLLVATSHQPVILPLRGRESLL
jgi:predicted ATPase